jgi:hypothetical protein
LTPALPDSLPPPGEPIADEPSWRFRIGPRGVAHQQAGKTAGKADRPRRVEGVDGCWSGFGGHLAYLLRLGVSAAVHPGRVGLVSIAVDCIGALINPVVRGCLGAV